MDSREYELGEVSGGAFGINCEQPGCMESSWTVLLSKLEVNTLNETYPDLVLDGLAHGLEVTRMIFIQKMGQVLCDDHLKSKDDDL